MVGSRLSYKCQEDPPGTPQHSPSLLTELLGFATQAPIQKLFLRAPRWIHLSLLPQSGSLSLKADFVNLPHIFVRQSPP